MDDAGSGTKMLDDAARTIEQSANINQALDSGARNLESLSR